LSHQIGGRACIIIIIITEETGRFTVLEILQAVAAYPSCEGMLEQNKPLESKESKKMGSVLQHATEIRSSIYGLGSVFGGQH
jgi:hypothetical protein